MTAGLPGTGIGGLFYMILVLLMPFVELARTLRGRGSAARWRQVAVHWALAVGIFATLYSAGWVVRALFDALLRADIVGAAVRQSVMNSATVSSTTALLTAIAILTIVVVGAAVVGLLARPRGAEALR